MLGYRQLPLQRLYYTISTEIHGETATNMLSDYRNINIEIISLCIVVYVHSSSYLRKEKRSINSKRIY